MKKLVQRKMGEQYLKCDLSNEELLLYGERTPRTAAGRRRGDAMTEETAVTVVQQSQQLSIRQVADRVNLVHEVLEKVLKKNTHYGTVPGCGSKMVLLKPGADVLAMTFRLVPRFEITRTDLENGHREYDVTCSMSGIEGNLLGQGVGSASTMEKKYRYRYEGGTWDPAQGKKVGAKKIENEDIADCYNTVLKMAKKRAHIDATLTVTGAADIFTQDLIDEDEPKKKPVEMPKESKAAPAKAGVISEKQRKRLFAIATNANVEQDALKQHLVDEYGISHTRDITRDTYEEICAWAEAGGQVVE